MKPFLDTSLSDSLDKFAKVKDDDFIPDKLATDISSEEIASSLYRLIAEEKENEFQIKLSDVILAAREVISERPTDNGMKYAMGQLKALQKELGDVVLTPKYFNLIREACSNQFSYKSYSEEFFQNDLIRLSAKSSLDPDFLSKVASLITSQEDYNQKMLELGYGVNRADCNDAREFILHRVNSSLNINDEYFKPLDFNLVGVDGFEVLQESVERFKPKSSKSLLTVLREASVIKKAELPKELEYLKYYEGPAIYFGPETPEYQIFDAEVGEDWADMVAELLHFGLTVLYDSVNDQYEVGSTMAGTASKKKALKK